MTQLIKRILMTTVFLGSVVGVNSIAQESTTQISPLPPAGERHHHHHHGGFFLGVCVGQTLATSTPPVILQPGKHDPSVKAKIEAAKSTCKAAFEASHKPGSGA